MKSDNVRMHYCWTFASGEAFPESVRLRTPWWAERSVSEPKRYSNPEQSLQIFFELDETDSLPFALIENHIEAAFALQAGRLYSGLIGLFDVNLSRLLLDQFRHSTGGRDGNALFEEQYPRERPPLGDYRVRGWGTQALERAFPLHVRQLLTENVILVTTDEQRRELKKLLPDALVGTLPLSFRPPEHSSVAEEAKMLRRFLQISSDTSVLGIVPQNGEMISANQTLSALSELGAVLLLWMTDSDEDSEKAQEFISSYGMNEKARVLQAHTNEEWSSFHSVFDVLISLATERGAGPSRSELEALERGIPIVSNAFGYVAELSRSCGSGVVVEENRYFDSTVARVLRELTEQPEFLGVLQGNVVAEIAQRNPASGAEKLQATVDGYRAELLQIRGQQRRRLEEATSRLIAERATLREQDTVCTGVRRDLNALGASLGWRPAKGRVLHGL